MTQLIYSPRFANELALVKSPRVEDNIYNMLELLEAMPSIGSANIAKSIHDEFGGDVRKLVVDPFDIIYEYLREDDLIYVYALIHQRMAW